MEPFSLGRESIKNLKKTESEGLRTGGKESPGRVGWRFFVLGVISCILLPYFSAIQQTSQSGRSKF
jgi:hypothetical protein